QMCKQIDKQADFEKMFRECLADLENNLNKCLEKDDDDSKRVEKEKIKAQFLWFNAPNKYQSIIDSFFNLLQQAQIKKFTKRNNPEIPAKELATYISDGRKGNTEEKKSSHSAQDIKTEIDKTIRDLFTLTPFSSAHERVNQIIFALDLINAIYE